MFEPEVLARFPDEELIRCRNSVNEALTQFVKVSPYVPDDASSRKPLDALMADAASFKESVEAEIDRRKQA